MSRKRPLIIALALATASASLLAVAAAGAQPAAAATACPWVGSTAPISHAGQRADGQDDAQAQEIALMTGRERFELRRVHPGDRLAVHPGDEPGGRPGRASATG